VYTLPQAAFTPNTTISSSAVNSDFSDIAAQMTNSLAADGQTTMTGPVKAASGTAAAPSYTFGSDTNTGFYSAGADIIGIAVGGVAVGQITSNGIVNGVPIGIVASFAGTSAPSGWLLCFGQSLATATYPALFTAIAYTYGGSGPNFSLPDCRGKADFGKDDMGGVAAGLITVAGGNFDGTVLGGTGGQQNKTILQAHFPAVTLSTSIGSGQGSHTHAAGGAGATIGGTSSASFVLGAGAAAPSPVNTVTLQNNTLPAMTGTTPTGGSGTALPTLSNAIIFNKIIFAGV
jgi:microcystin-dependent protein